MSEGDFIMNILDVIKTRRIIKKFKRDMIDKNIIITWLQAAAMAPNHRMTEPWEVYFIGKETRSNLKHKTDFGNAPVLLAVLSKHGSTAIERAENAAATACFIQNLLLAAWSEGVGSAWSSIGISPKNHLLLSIPDNYDLLGILAIGYPEEIPAPKPRTPIEKKIKNLP